MSPRLDVESSDLGQVVTLSTEGRGGTPLRAQVVPDAPAGGAEWSNYSPTLVVVFGGIDPVSLRQFAPFYYQVLVSALGRRLLQVQGKVQFDNLDGTFNGAFSVTLPPGFTVASPNLTGVASGYTNLPVCGAVWPNNPDDAVVEMRWFDPGPGGANATVDVSFTVEVV